MCLPRLAACFSRIGSRASEALVQASRVIHHGYNTSIVEVSENKFNNFLRIIGHGMEEAGGEYLDDGEATTNRVSGLGALAPARTTHSRALMLRPS